MRTLTLLTLLLLVSACTTTTHDEGSESREYVADIRWTSHGIPHIRALDWGSLGYGLAYAVATDAICVLAEEFVTVQGERARYFGDNEDNIDSDVFHRALLDDETLARYIAANNPDSREMLQGYINGYNRFVEDQQSTLPDDCAGEAWVKPIEMDDLARLGIGVGIRYGLGRFSKSIANAVPGHPSLQVATLDASLPALSEPGSNALAFGRNLTENGRGILMGNPHYPWHGPSRFHMAHLTIPGELDVMGVGLITTPRVAIGFNRHVAWTHTVSTALRFTLFRLDVDPNDPLTYLVDGLPYPIEARQVRVAVEGRAEPLNETVYMTHLGPVLTTRDTPWSREHVFVLRDINFENSRGSNQYHALDRATNIEEVKAALATHQGVSFVNTIAADRDGNAFYADMSAIPFVTSEQIEECRVPPERVDRWRVIVLDGSRGECNWQTSPTAAAPGLMPPEQQPSLITPDFVSNSNDSHWLSSPTERLEGFSPIIGDERTARSLRTRAGLAFVQEVLEAGRPVTPQIVQDILFSHRHYGAELLLDDILTICAEAEKTIDVAAACGILGDWDRRQDVDSVGAQIYNELWSAIGRDIDRHFAIPFDVEDPVRTPRQLTTDDPATRTLVMEGLETALGRLAAADVMPMAPWGEVQFAERHGERIGVPGGDGGAGMYSVISARLNDEKHGYTPIIHGNSYVQVVTWRDDGTPDARALLTYSQSPQPESPWYADQTRLYSNSEWIRLPFTESEIEADLVQSLRLSGPRP